MSSSLTDLAVRRVLAALSADDLMAVATGRGLLEVRPSGPTSPTRPSSGSTPSPARGCIAPRPPAAWPRHPGARP